MMFVCVDHVCMYTGMCAFVCLQTGVFMRACVHSHPCTSLDVNSGHLYGSAFRNIASLDVCTMCTAGAVHIQVLYTRAAMHREDRPHSRLWAIQLQLSNGGKVTHPSVLRNSGSKLSTRSRLKASKLMTFLTSTADCLVR